jgi:hypothetical protein
MGRLIPAGTGLPAYKRLQMIVEEERSQTSSPAVEHVGHASLAGAE